MLFNYTFLVPVPSYLQQGKASNCKLSGVSCKLSHQPLREHKLPRHCPRKTSGHGWSNRFMHSHCDTSQWLLWSSLTSEYQRKSISWNQDSSLSRHLSYPKPSPQHDRPRTSVIVPVAAEGCTQKVPWLEPHCLSEKGRVAMTCSRPLDTNSAETWHVLYRFLWVPFTILHPSCDCVRPVESMPSLRSLFLELFCDIFHLSPLPIAAKQAVKWRHYFVQ